MTELSRRSLIRAGAGGLIVVPFIPTSTAFAAAPAGRALYTRTRFEPLRHKRFRLTGASGRWSATLIKISDLSGTARGDKHRFCLTFSSAVAGPPQGTYTIRRSRFKATRLFLVPSDASRRTYHAIINRAS